MEVSPALFRPKYHREPYAALNSTAAAGKVVVITGGGSGIGRATAKTFAESSAKAIVLLGRRESRLLETKRDLEVIFGKQGNTTSSVSTYSTDITDVASVNATFKSIADRFRAVDVLINNAGYLPDLARFDQSDFDDWWSAFEVNVKGPANTVRSFLQIASPGATLINITSNLAHLPPYPGTSAYTASKIATVRFMEFIQQEHPHLRVFNLHPGLIATEMSAKSSTESSQESVDLPAKFCLWLVDPKADFLKNRLVWSSWDVDELEQRKEEIVQGSLLTVGLKGF
ncbi:hypothetical protein DIZ76_011449 [Coccidioides immitis]|nr:hypothetical protein DIZ76_011449 [Coccidioides immitis]